MCDCNLYVLKIFCESLRYVFLYYIDCKFFLQFTYYKFNWSVFFQKSLPLQLNGVVHKSQLAEEKALIGKQNESTKKIKQYERKQKREIIIDEDIDLGRVFKLATTTNMFVNSLNLYEITNEFF